MKKVNAGETKRTRAVVELIEAIDAYCEQYRRDPRDMQAIARVCTRVDAAYARVPQGVGVMARLLVHALQPRELVMVDLKADTPEWVSVTAFPVRASGIRRPASGRRGRASNAAA